MTAIWDLIHGNHNVFLSISVAVCEYIPNTFVRKALAIILLFIVYIIFKLSYWKRRGVANDALSVFTQFTKPMFLSDLKVCLKHGKIFGIYEGLTPALMVSEPKLVRQVLVTDFHRFPNCKFELDGGNQIASNALFGLRYKPWKRVRSVISSAFTKNHIKLMIPLIESKVKYLLSNFETIAINGKSVDVRKYFAAFIMDVIVTCAMGGQINSLQNPDNDLVKSVKQILRRKSVVRSIFSLFFSSIAKRHSNFDHERNAWHNLFKIMESISNERKNKGTKRNDFLQLMLDKIDESEKRNLQSLNEAIDQIISFLICGFDTTSTALAFAAYCLALHPEHQHQLIEEIDEIDDESSFDVDEIDSLKYLDAFVCEVLRYMPPVPRIERRAAEDTYLGNIFVPKNTLIVIPIYAIHRDDSNFRDANKFSPERFLEEPSTHQCYLPFAAGPRNCIGWQFAVLEIKLCLVSVLKKFRFQTCSQTKIPLEYYTGQLVSIPKEVTLNISKR